MAFLESIYVFNHLKVLLYYSYSRSSVSPFKRLSGKKLSSQPEAASSIRIMATAGGLRNVTSYKCRRPNTDPEARAKKMMCVVIPNLACCFLPGVPRWQNTGPLTITLLNIVLLAFPEFLKSWMFLLCPNDLDGTPNRATFHAGVAKANTDRLDWQREWKKERDWSKSRSRLIAWPKAARLHIW